MIETLTKATGGVTQQTLAGLWKMERGRINGSWQIEKLRPNFPRETRGGLLQFYFYGCDKYPCKKQFKEEGFLWIIIPMNSVSCQRT